MNLDGRALYYFIGRDKTPHVNDDHAVIEAPYRGLPMPETPTIGYCNFFDEEGTGKYAPYLHDSDTAEEYGEGQIDPHGEGWTRNLKDQFVRRRREGFTAIELDNADSQALGYTIRGYDLASEYGLSVIAKNPGLVEGCVSMVSHPSVIGMIVEAGAGTPESMDKVRTLANRPTLWTFFVFFSRGQARATTFTQTIRKKGLKNMGVSYCNIGEYRYVSILQRPVWP